MDLIEILIFIKIKEIKIKIKEIKKTMKKLIVFFVTLFAFGSIPFLTSACSVLFSGIDCDPSSHKINFTIKTYIAGDGIDRYSIHANQHDITNEISYTATDLGGGWWQFDCVWSSSSIEPGNNYTFKAEIWTTSGKYCKEDDVCVSCAGCADRDRFSDFDLPGNGWIGWRGQIVKCVDNSVIVARDNKGITGLRVYMDRQGNDREVIWIGGTKFTSSDYSSSGWVDGVTWHDFRGTMEQYIEIHCPNNQFLKGFKFVRIRDGDSDEDGIAFQYKCGTLNSSGGSWGCDCTAVGGSNMRCGNNSLFSGWCLVNEEALSGGSKKWDDSGTFTIGSNEVFSGLGWLYDYSSGGDKDYFSFNFRYQEVTPPPAPNVTIKGLVYDQNGDGIGNVTLNLCGAGSATTNSSGYWEKRNVNSGSGFCVRISSGIPQGSTVKAVNNTSCHSNASTYEWQIAGENRFQGCGYNDERSWDRASDSGYDFVVERPTGSLSITIRNASCDLSNKKITFTVETQEDGFESLDGGYIKIDGEDVTSNPNLDDDCTCTGSPQEGNKACTHYFTWYNPSLTAGTHNIEAKIWASNKTAVDTAWVTCGTYQCKRCSGSNCVTQTFSSPCSDECQTDSDCEDCNCGPWIDQGCGENNCTPIRMWQTRTCTPPGCRAEERCVSDPSCNPPEINISGCDCPEGGGDFTITATASHSLGIDTIEIMYKEDSESSWHLANSCYNTNICNGTITGEAGKSYDIRVYAEANSGSSDYKNCSTTCPEPTFQCTGSLPAHSSPWGSDENQNLTEDLPWQYSDSDTSRKCEFHCNTGYSWNGSSCIAVPPTCSIHFIPSSIELGESSTLSWNSNNCTSANLQCSGAGINWSNSSCSGSHSFTPSATSTLSCSFTPSGPGGSNSCSANLNVIPPQPHLTLNIDPSEIKLAQSATISWSTENCSSCTASVDPDCPECNWDGAKLLSGSQEIRPESPGTYTFTLTCFGEGGSTSEESATLKVYRIPWWEVLASKLIGIFK